MRKTHKAGLQRTGITISNPEKILFPQSHIRKEEVVEYYDRISSYMLPFLKNRPVALQRYPEGITGENFFQKSVPEYYPDFIKRVTVIDSEGEKQHGIINNRQGLIFIANTAALHIHTWQSSLKKLEYPDQIIWDLDPSDESFEKVRIAARLLKYFLEKLGLDPYIKTTGSRGVHILVPVERKYTYDEIKVFTREVGEYMARTIPQLFTMEIRKIKRGNKVLIDYLRNQYGHTAIAPFSVRAVEGAPVAAPVLWDELDRITSQTYNIHNIIPHLESKGNPWEDLYQQPQPLDEAMEELKKLKRSKEPVILQ